MEIKITRAGRVCRRCEREFVHDELFNSLVRYEENALNREDYCKTCWQEELAQGAYSAWEPRYYDPRVAEQAPAEVFSPLRQLFYEAVVSEDRVEAAKAYLAAQLLRRQKVFRLIKESDEAEAEARISLFTDRIGNRLIEVRDPNFSYGELEEGRRNLLKRLHELEHPETNETNTDGQ